MESSLKEKIKDLFEYRHIPQLMAMAVKEDHDAKHDFLERLYELQGYIYRLDAVLESRWDLVKKDLIPAWKNIFDSLEHLGIDAGDIRGYCSHIFKYQDHELGQRRNKSLLRFKLEYLYFYKSCDVKLIRRLLFERFRILHSYFTLADWRWFDLITEVNDDIDDVFEDMGTNNGNRFLIGITKNGMEETILEYQVFISYIKTRFLEKNNYRKFHDLVIELTLKACEETQKLLVEREKDLYHFYRMRQLSTG